MIDEVLVYLFNGPESFTKENIVEISCHNLPSSSNEIVAIHKHGARHAKPGEFTLRAFLNGKLDLAQAEAVADLLHHSQAAHQVALNKCAAASPRAKEPP